MNAHYILVISRCGPLANKWHDSGEGPFPDLQTALDFANAEIGVPWIVVDVYGTPLQFGDARGVYGGSCSYRPIPRTTLMKRID